MSRPALTFAQFELIQSLLTGSESDMFDPGSYPDWDGTSSITIWHIAQAALPGKKDVNAWAVKYNDDYHIILDQYGNIVYQGNGQPQLVVYGNVFYIFPPHREYIERFTNEVNFIVTNEEKKDV